MAPTVPEIESRSRLIDFHRGLSRGIWTPGLNGFGTLSHDRLNLKHYWFLDHTGSTVGSHNVAPPLNPVPVTHSPTTLEGRGWSTIERNTMESLATSAPVTGPGQASETAGLLCVCAAGFAFSVSYTNHAPVVPALIAEFHFSQAMAGLLTTGIFLTHAAMQIPAGHVADRLGSTRVLAAALAIVGLANLGIGFASAYTHLLWWKIFAGLGTGACFVSGARYITGLFTGPRMHLAQGLYGGSVLLGSGFVIFAVPQFLAAFGWRGTFFATACLALAVLAAWMLAAPRPPAPPRASGSFAGMLTDPQLWMLGLVQMASFGLAIVAGSWIASLLRNSLGASPARAGLAGSLVLLLGIVTRPLGGVLAPRFGVPATLRAGLLVR